MKTTLVTLPRKRNIGMKTQQMRYARIENGLTVFLRSIQYYVIQTGYARGGMPGALGPVSGYMVAVDDADGCEIYHVEIRQQEAAEVLFDAIVERPAEFLDLANVVLTP